MLVIERQHFLPPAAPAISYLAVIVIITIIIGFLKVMKDLKLIWLCIFFYNPFFLPYHRQHDHFDKFVSNSIFISLAAEGDAPRQG